MSAPEARAAVSFLCFMALWMRKLRPGEVKWLPKVVEPQTKPQAFSLWVSRLTLPVVEWSGEI